MRTIILELDCHECGGPMGIGDDETRRRCHEAVDALLDSRGGAGYNGWLCESCTARGIRGGLRLSERE
jgi:hypothetical protein